LHGRQRGGRIVVPARPAEWNFNLEARSHTAAFVGLDAFSAPIQQPGGRTADGRMLYAATLYTPVKSWTHCLVDFELDGIAGQLREAATALGLGRANHPVAICDSGNGLEEALRRHIWNDMTCILDWHHAAEHLRNYAKTLHPRDDAARRDWAGRAKELLWEHGGTALLAWLRQQAPPADETVAEDLRKLTGYFANTERTTRATARTAGTSAPGRRRPGAR